MAARGKWNVFFFSGYQIFGQARLGWKTNWRMGRRRSKEEAKVEQEAGDAEGDTVGQEEDE